MSKLVVVMFPDAAMIHEVIGALKKLRAERTIRALCFDRCCKGCERKAVGTGGHQRRTWRHSGRRSHRRVGGFASWSARGDDRGCRRRVDRRFSRSNQ